MFDPHPFLKTHTCQWVGGRYIANGCVACTDSSYIEQLASEEAHKVDDLDDRCSEEFDKWHDRNHGKGCNCDIAWYAWSAAWEAREQPSRSLPS